MPLSEPLRLEIKMRLTEALKQITTANGYVTEVGDSVFRGRAVYGDKDPLPMISILEVPIPVDLPPAPAGSTYSTGAWELMIQGFAVDERDNPTDPADRMLADTKKRLAIERKKGAGRRAPADGILGLGNHITNIQIGPGVVRPPDELSAKAYFWLTIQLELAEDLEDPTGDQ